MSIFVTTLNHSVLSQKLNFDAMIDNADCQTISCFKDFVETKVFGYLSEQNYEDFKLHIFASMDFTPVTSNPTVTNSNLIFLAFSKDDSYTSVAMSTGDQTYYSALIDQIKAKGFENQKTDTTTDGRLNASYTSSMYKNLSVSAMTQTQITNGNS